MTDQELMLVRRTEAGTLICKDGDGRDVVVLERPPDWASTRARHDELYRNWICRNPSQKRTGEIEED